MSSTITIEVMVPEDLTAVVGIERSSFQDPWPEEVFRAELRHSWSHCHVLKSDGKIIGYLVFWRVADEVHLLNVAVLPEERHHRYGTMLVDYLQEQGKATGARFITLEVRSSNEAAIRLYKAGGFKVVGVRPKYYANDREDTVVMLYDCGSNSGVQPLPQVPRPDA